MTFSLLNFTVHIRKEEVQDTKHSRQSNGHTRKCAVPHQVGSTLLRVYEQQRY